MLEEESGHAQNGGQLRLERCAANIKSFEMIDRGGGLYVCHCVKLLDGAQHGHFFFIFDSSGHGRASYGTLD